MTFVATQNKGFGMTFDNGFTISVQWGTMNYCERKNLMAKYKNEMEYDITESINAEIAVYDDEEMINIGEDTVIGWCSPDVITTTTEQLEQLIYSMISL